MLALRTPELAMITAQFRLATRQTGGSSFDTIMAAYTGGSLAGLSLVADNDDYVGVTSQISFFATAGTVYQIAVDGHGVESGSINLLLQQ